MAAGGACRSRWAGSSPQGKMPLGGKGREKRRRVRGQRAPKGEEAHPQILRGWGKKEMSKTAADAHTGKKFNTEAEGKYRAEEEETGGKSEGQTVFLQEKISAIHADPEALIGGGEGTRRVEALSNALLPTDPQTPQPGRPGSGLGWGSRRDGGGVSGEVSQVKGRNGPQPVRKGHLLAAGDCREGGSPKPSAQAEQGPGQSGRRLRLHGAGQRQSCP